MSSAQADFPLFQNPFGKLVWVLPDGTHQEGVAPVRAFPIQSPDEGIALVTPTGSELCWIDHLENVPEPAQSLIRQELSTRECIPVVSEIYSVTSFSTPCTWHVHTDRGRTHFVLRGDEDIRRIGAQHALLITDSHGIQYLVKDVLALNAQSRKIIDRFL